LAAQGEWRCPEDYGETTSSYPFLKLLGGIHMQLFDCCINCKKPKRHSGCHSQCAEYKKGRALLDKRNQSIRKSKELERLFYRPGR
jgi:hypothetical protein